MKTFSGIYKAPKSVAVQNDIKGILVAGGLNTRNPSAPTQTTKVAEIMNSTKPSQAVTQLVAKLEGSSVGPRGLVPSSNVGGNRVTPAAEPTTLIASIQQHQRSPQPKSKTLDREKRTVQPSQPADPVMLALSTVAPTPTARPREITEEKFDVTPVAIASEAQAPSRIYTAQTDELTTRYPDIGVEVAYAAPAASPKPKAAPKRARPVRAVPSPVVEAPGPVIQQASVQFTKPRRF
ncbi:hypothetical protein [Mesorhizobium sp. SP-1A]|uniref:hypothetical protein n=1 Tax=Mesorhizobium sp. SP-1A TaxID=3077840 RepID=UPI0028F6F207|nr:hypothetical protein [Mesorhizobium sp. SP-1A]